MNETRSSPEKKHTAGPRPERRYGSMKRRWIANSLSVVSALIIFAVLTISFGVGQYYYDSLKIQLSNRALSTSEFISTFLSRSYEEFYTNSEQIVSSFAEKDRLELQIVDSTGRVMFSSSGISAGFIPLTGDVEQSLAGNAPAVWSGVNPTTGERVMSASSPLYYYSGQVIGAVRYSTSMVKVDRHIYLFSISAAAVGLAVFLLVFFSNYYFIRSIVNPVLRLNEMARAIAAGSYGIQIENQSSDEIGELCNSINYMSEQISRSEKMRNDILSSVSHELRTPLTAISGWTETLMAGENLPPLEQQGLSIIHDEARRLNQMVEELLDYARLEGDRLFIQTAVFDLSGEFADAVYMYTEFFKRCGITIHYNEPDEPVMVMGDRDRLRQVFINILDNAAKYGAAGGRIDLSISTHDHQAVVTIHDYGAGIPAENLPYIKDKFYRGSQQTGRGTGIGLSVSEEIIKLHGGTLEIESPGQRGTIVRVSLPLYTPTAE